MLASLAVLKEIKQTDRHTKIALYTLDFTVLHNTFQAIDINRLYFNIKVFKTIETKIYIFLFTFQGLFQSRLVTYHGAYLSATYYLKNNILGSI